MAQLQRELGVATFFRFHRGHRFAFSALVDPISKAFVAVLEQLARCQKIPVVQLRKGQRKDDIAAGFFHAAPIPDDCRPSVTASVPRRSTIRCANGCGCCRIPTPSRAAGLAIVTMSRFCRRSSRSLKCWTDPGRVLFEEVIWENLDIGRPSQVQLIFDRRVSGRTPGRFRTRVITDGVIPSLHVDYKSTRIKQYHKEGRALRTLRTETTINNTRDFGIGKKLKNLPALRQAWPRPSQEHLSPARNRRHSENWQSPCYVLGASPIPTVKPTCRTSS
jgi:hypothetical protein